MNLTSLSQSPLETVKAHPLSFEEMSCILLPTVDMGLTQHCSHTRQTLARARESSAAGFAAAGEPKGVLHGAICFSLRYTPLIKTLKYVDIAVDRASQMPKAFLQGCINFRS